MVRDAPAGAASGPRRSAARTGANASAGGPRLAPRRDRDDALRPAGHRGVSRLRIRQGPSRRRTERPSSVGGSPPSRTALDKRPLTETSEPEPVSERGPTPGG